MNRIMSFILLLAVCGHAGAQQGSADTYLNNYVSPAPTAASLGKFVDFPISYYTGTVDITVPIYELKDGAANMPISLGYHPSGIRVAELASSVGLGWALNAGGMIIRTVRGAPDEGSSKGGNTAYGPVGYFVDKGIGSLPLLPYPVAGQIQNDPANEEMTQFTIPGVNSGTYDGEPDLFTFNFNGYSGKFVFDENQNPRLLTDDNLVITPNYNGTTFATWEITTPDGAQYFFGENSVYEVTTPSSTITGSDPDSRFPSSWYLTRIVYPNTLDTVHLSYTAESYGYHDLGPESALFGASGQPLAWACSWLTPGVNVITTYITGWHLSSITSKNYTVNFVTNTTRQDLLYSPPMLDSIKICNSAGTCIKKFALGHSYFTSTSTTGLPPGIISDSTDMKRLMLATVTEFSGDGTITKPPYRFTYNQSIQLPRRMSYDQDGWGFSNDSYGGANSCLTPGVNYPICTTQTGGLGSNRNARWPDMSAFSLSAIKDPLGVVTNFTYQANSLTNTYPQSSVVGGLRIQQIATTDSVTGITTYRTFTYAGGMLYKNPVYLLDLNNEYYTGTTLPAQTGGYRGYAFQRVISNILKQSQSIVPLQDFNGNHIGYANVTETFGARGEGGSRQYLYQVDIAPHDNSRLNQSNFATLTSINTIYGASEGIYGNGSFNNILPQNLAYYQGYDVYNYYPLAPDQVDLRRGKLLGENTYDSLGNLLKSVQNTYQETYHEWMPIRGFKAYRTTAYTASGLPWNYDALTYYKLHTGVSHLVLSVETDYKDSKQMTITHRYGYEDTLHTLRTSDTTVNSEGDSLITKTYYSYDYANSATTDNIFGKMKVRHMLIPIATRTWKNNQLIKGTVTRFEDFATSSVDTFINPAKIYAFQTSTPLTASQAGETVAFTSPWTTLLPGTNFFEKADFNFLGTTGRVIEQRLTNDKNQALVWDNINHLPLAKVENSYFADVAYCSFETAETGTWTLNSGSIVSDAGAPTGTHAYSMSGALSKPGLTSTQTYVFSYWLKSGASVSISGGTQSSAVTGRTLGSYTYHEVKITGATSLSITGSGNVDEVRLYPSTAQMTSYTYDPLLRLIAECSANSTITYYDYDSMNRLVDIRDQYGNVIKAFEYNYGQLAR
jgi:hypothetical protein